MSAGWTRVGARSVFVMVSEVEVLLVTVPSFTCQLMPYVPASENPGVPLSVAVLGEGPGVEANVKNAGAPVWVMVRVLPASGSVAVAVIVGSGVPSGPVTVAGALITGGEFPLEERAPSQSNQSPAKPLMVPHGSAGSPTT